MQFNQFVKKQQQKIQMTCKTETIALEMEACLSAYQTVS